MLEAFDICEMQALTLEAQHNLFIRLILHAQGLAQCLNSKEDNETHHAQNLWINVQLWVQKVGWVVQDINLHISRYRLMGLHAQAVVADACLCIDPQWPSTFVTIKLQSSAAFSCQSQGACWCRCLNSYPVSRKQFHRWAWVYGTLKWQGETSLGIASSYLSKIPAVMWSSTFVRYEPTHDVQACTNCYSSLTNLEQAHANSLFRPGILPWLLLSTTHETFIHSSAFCILLLKEPRSESTAVSLQPARQTRSGGTNSKCKRETTERLLERVKAIRRIELGSEIWNIKNCDCRIWKPSWCISAISRGCLL